MSKILKFKKYIVVVSAIITSLLFGSCGAMNKFSGEVPTDQLQVHFISVGQGDSELIKLPTGENVLIDSGDTFAAETLLNYLKNNGVETIDLAVATHPHSDHIGSMQSVMENFEVKKILRPDCDYDSLVYTDFLYSIEENGVEEIIPKPGDTFDVGDAHFEVLGPVKEYEDVNNASIVLMMTYGETKFLFTGDQQADAEADIISMGYDLRANVLKVGHHGSDTSTSGEFIEAVRPEIAVIEVGEGNSYSLPSDGVVMNLARRGATVYRTDQSGNIIITSDGKKLGVFTDDTLESFSDYLFGVS